MSRWVRITSAVLAVVAVVVTPTTAHADAAAPTDWRTEVVSVDPETDVVAVTIEGVDAFVRISVDPGHDVVVLGYVGEPYLWIDAGGTVHENRRSQATYYNRTRDGTTEIPDGVDPSAPPEWAVIGDGGAWAWHDHRAHWMGGRPPVGMEPGRSLPKSVVPLVVDGVATEITLVTTLLAAPSPWPAVGGALAGGALVALTLVPRRRVPVAAALVAVGATAGVLGVVQYLSLPAETGPRLVWWLPPAVTVACGLVLLLRRASSVGRAGLVLVGGSQLVVWGWLRRAGLVRAALPTPAPFWLDRCVTAAALAVGIGLGAAAVVELAGVVRQDSRARSIASSSSS